MNWSLVIFSSAFDTNIGVGVVSPIIGTEGNPNRLWVWATRELTTYVGDEINIGNFDIANITLLAPADDVRIDLPYTFQWAPRAATPTDVYEFDLYDPYDRAPYAYAVVGYTGAFTLNALPAGFNASDQDWYWWEIWVYSPDGGYGISCESRWISFNNTGYAPVKGPTQMLLTKPERLVEDWPGRLPAASDYEKP